MRAVVLPIARLCGSSWRYGREMSCSGVGRMESSGCHWKTFVNISHIAMFNSKINAVHPQVCTGLSQCKCVMTTHTSSPLHVYNHTSFMCIIC